MLRPARLRRMKRPCQSDSAETGESKAECGGAEQGLQQLQGPTGQQDVHAHGLHSIEVTQAKMIMY